MDTDTGARRVHGTVLVDEMIFPIIEFRMIRGRLVWTAQIEGPCRAGAAEYYLLIGEDGRQVIRSARKQNLGWPRLAAGGTCFLTVEIELLAPLEVTGPSPEVDNLPVRLTELPPWFPPTP